MQDFTKKYPPKYTFSEASPAQPQAAVISAPKRAMSVISASILFALAAWISTSGVPDYKLKDLKQISIPYTDARQIQQSLKIASAYAMTNVEIAQFDRTQTTHMPDEEGYYLEQLFELVDLGIIERVQWFSLMYHKQDYAHLSDNHALILMQLSTLNPPKRLEKVHYLILNAISEEQEYFRRWKQNPEQSFSPSDDLVQSSHKKLLAAYNILMEAYAEEDKRTKRSFYSHLCALSFI